MHIKQGNGKANAKAKKVLRISTSSDKNKKNWSLNSHPLLLPSTEGKQLLYHKNEEIRLHLVIYTLLLECSWNWQPANSQGYMKTSSACVWIRSSWFLKMFPSLRSRCFELRRQAAAHEPVDLKAQYPAGKMTIVIEYEFPNNFLCHLNFGNQCICK